MTTTDNRSELEPEAMDFDDRVTLVIAGYNHAEYLEAALRSAFEQTHPSCDVIVTDDASTDDSQQRIGALLSEHGWAARTILHDRNAGICATFNEALALVQTPFVAFMSADDLMHPPRIERQVAVFRDGGKDLVLVASDMDCMGPEGDLWHDRFSDLIRQPDGLREGIVPGFDSLVEHLWIGAPSVLMRTQAIRYVGGFDECLPFEDYDMFLRLARVGSFGYVDECLVRYRRGNGLGQRLAQSDEKLIGMVRMFSKHLDSPVAIEKVRHRLFDFTARAFDRGLIPPSQARRFMWPYVKKQWHLGPWSVMIRAIINRPKLQRRRKRAG